MALTFSVPDTQLTLTLQNRRNQVIDQVYVGNPFWAAMAAHGGMKTESGGDELITPLRMSKSTSGGSYSSFDIFDTTPQDNETSAKTPWSHEYQTVSVAGTDILKNMGPGKLIDWVSQKQDDAYAAIMDRIATNMMATPPAAGSKDSVSITEVIQDVPATDAARTASHGSILGSTQSWWRNVATSGGAFTVADMNTMWNDVSDGHDFPQFLLTSQTVHEYYHNSLTGLIRYDNVANRTADQGFTELLFMKSPIVWDPQIGLTDNIYFINTKYLRIVTHEADDFVQHEFIEPANQNAKVAKITWTGNLENVNRRRTGVLYDITAPA